jgi:hypothetical protein
MTIKVREDEYEGGGYAYLDLDRRVHAASPRISIRRLNAEPRHLGSDGWQFDPVWLTPLSCDNSGDTTTLYLGPEIVDQIEELVPIEIGVEHETSVDRLTWPAITPSPQSITDIGLQGAKKAQRAPERPEPPAPDTNASPAPTRYEPDAAVIAAVAEAAFTVPPPERLAPPTPERRSGFWVIAMILLGLAAAAAAGYVWRPDFFQDAYATLAEAAKQRLAPNPAPPEDAGGGPVTRTLSAEELDRKYQALVDAGADAPRLLDLAHEALRAGNARTAFRALEEANPFTNSDAAFEIAHFYDPRNNDPSYRSFARPDAARAASYYAEWKTRSPKHAAELTSLCAEYSAEQSSNSRFEAACRR